MLHNLLKLNRLISSQSMLMTLKQLSEQKKEPMSIWMNQSPRMIFNSPRNRKNIRKIENSIYFWFTLSITLVQKSLRRGQWLKAVSSKRILDVSRNLTDLRLSQLLNAWSPISPTFGGISMASTPDW